MTFTLAGYNGSASVKMVYSHNWSSVPPKNQIASPIMEISFQKAIAEKNEEKMLRITVSRPLIMAFAAKIIHYSGKFSNT